MLLPPTERRESGAIIPSASQTQTNAQPSIPRPVRVPDGTLRLRGGPVEDRRVRWGADVIDNEGLGRKKSKGLLLNFLDSWSFELQTLASEHQLTCDFPLQ